MKQHFVEETSDEIYVTHLRELKTTIAVLLEGDCAMVGFATCSSKDQWCRKIGRHIAVGRAKKAMQYVHTPHTRLCTVPDHIQTATRKDRITWAIELAKSLFH